ncbi:MAG: MupG family TIM beta-alpha barrel fold protein [Ignavibacteriales bacterium]
MPGTAGISVYPGSGDHRRAIEYAAGASRLGYRNVFTSLHITEQEPSEGVGFIREIAAACHGFGLRVVADVSPRTFRALGATPSNLNPFADLGLSGIRVDFGYGIDEISAMTRAGSGLTVVLNASTIDGKWLSAFVASGADMSHVETCHNYYPRPETGLSMDFLVRRADLLRQYGVAVWAFLPSASGRRGPLFEGLPTAERHRAAPVWSAAAEYAATGAADVLLFGDPFASREELETLSRVWLSGAIPVRVRLAPGITQREKAVVFGGRHRNRADTAELAVRSSTSRGYAEKGEFIAPARCVSRPSGSVTVDNHLYLRYSGELQITMADLPPDPRVNVVGTVVEEDRPLVRMIGPEAEFYFIEAGEETAGIAGRAESGG